MILLNDNNEIGLDKNGFLEEVDFDSYLAKSCPNDFEFLRNINQYMYELYALVDISRDDEIGCFLVGTFNKIHKSTQAATVLVSRGLSDQVKILVRSNLDKLMVMQAVHNDKNNFNKWKLYQNYERKRLIDDIKKGEPGLGHLQERITEDISIPSDWKRISQRDWAKLAGMEEDYNVVYRLFSGNVHHSKNALNSDLFYDEGLPAIMDIAPNCTDTRELLLTLATDALRTMKIVVEYFDLDDAVYKELNKEHEENWRRIIEDR